MTTKNNWSHLVATGAVRARSKELSRSHRQMMSDLVDIRLERGMSQADVAELLGVSRQRVSKLEQYDANPRLDTVRRYANVVGAVISTHVEKDNRHESVDEEISSFSSPVFYPSKHVDLVVEQSVAQGESDASLQRSYSEWSDAILIASESHRTDFALGA